ncbi:MAG TPA: cyclase family protein [Candidatus Limnocylindrales bacterium]|nr:cyclase family protein [Candidatus Limnocylindrales bacterium]
MPRYLDLSHAIEDEQVTYPGLPAPKIEEHLSREASRAHYAPGTEFSIGRITMVGNTGTYLDSPFHRFADGRDLADLSLEQLVDLDGVLVRIAADADRNLGPELLDGLELRGKAVLFHTGWSRHFATPAYGAGHPYLTLDTAQALVDAGAALVGIDSLNIDDTADQARPVHTALLAAGIPIVEHLTGLDQLPPSGFKFNAVPARVRDFGTWPVRAFAVID